MTDDWHPIATVPADTNGTKSYLIYGLWRDEAGYEHWLYHIAHRLWGSDVWITDGYPSAKCLRPTNWQVLPKSPQREGAV